MENLLFGIALFLILLATGGSIVYIIKQRKTIYKWSNRILMAGFVFLTISLCYQYVNLGIIPVLDLKSALSFFAWIILGVYLILQLRFRLMVLSSFITPFTAVMLIVSSSIPGIEIAIKPMLKSTWLPIHVTTIFIGEDCLKTHLWNVCSNFYGCNYVPSSGASYKEQEKRFILLKTAFA